jgi:hypothetical protein
MRKPWLIYDPNTGAWSLTNPTDEYLGYDRPAPALDRRPLSGMQDMQLGGARVLNNGDRNVIIVEAGRGNMAGHPESITITLGQALATFPDDHEIVSAAQITDVKAEIAWGSGGASFTAFVDWMHGTTLTVIASWVRVKASYPPSGDGDNPSPAVSLTAGVGYGDIGESEGARFTRSLGNIGAGVTSPYFPIPPFATDFTLLSSSGAAPLGFLSEPAQIQVSSSVVVNPDFTNAFEYLGGSNANSQQPRTFPIFSGARYIRIRNSGANAATYTIVYNLTL